MVDTHQLYELSQATGHSLDLRVNCDHFLTSLMAAQHLDWATVWLRSGLVGDEPDGSPERFACIHAIPGSPPQRVLDAEAPAVKRAFELRARSLPLGDPDLRPFAPQGEREGNGAVVALGRLGLLAMGSRARHAIFSSEELGRLEGVLVKFAVSLEACTVHHRLQREANLRVRAEANLRHREEHFRALIEHAQDVIAVLAYDGTVRFISPSLEGVLGIHPDELRGRSVFELVHPEDLPEVFARFSRAVATAGPGRELETRLRHRDGSWRDLQVRANNLLGVAAVGGVVLHARDVTERNRALEALRRSEERYALAVRGTNDGLWDWDLTERQLYLSPRWEAILGYEEGGVEPNPDRWLELVHPDDRAILETTVRSYLEGGEELFHLEYRMLHRDGSYRWVLTRGLALRDERGRARRLVGSQSDVTDRRLYDPLCRLPNRTLFCDRVGRALDRLRRRSNRGFAVLVFDLDRFDLVNTSLGHTAGDRLLVLTAERLRECLRVEDTLARLAADEFAILVEDVRGLGDVRTVASRIEEAFNEPFALGEREVFVAGRLGVALGRADYGVPEEILADATTALRRAKRSGSDRSAIFDGAVHAEDREILLVDTELRHAVSRGELFMLYQPLISLAEGEVTGFEALVRWRHPRRGVLTPATFIPLAEETGSIHGIGEWVLKEVCRQLSAWQGTHDGRAQISVNLSARQLPRPELSREVAAVLESTGIEPSHLQFEITESAVLDHLERAAATLRELKALGVLLALDDFGTGYSSLSYVNRLPFDTLKIDRSFVDGLGRRAEDEAIARTIVKLAHTLDKAVVAEGIETSQQLEVLRAMECEVGQGFYFAYPLPPGDAELFLSHPGLSPWGRGAL